MPCCAAFKYSAVPPHKIGNFPDCSRALPPRHVTSFKPFTPQNKLQRHLGDYKDDVGLAIARLHQGKL